MFHIFSLVAPQDEIPKFVTAVCFGVNGEVITGDSTGSILVWQRDDSNIFTIDRQVSASMKEAHKVLDQACTFLNLFPVK